MEHLLRRVPRARITKHHRRKEKGSSRENSPEKNFLRPKKSRDLDLGREAQHQRQSAFTRYAQHPPARRASLIRKTVADSIAYRRVPKTYLSVQDRELLSAHTKPPARNGHTTNRFNAVRLLTRACACHGVHTPAHQVSENRPRKSSSQIDIIPPPDRALRGQTWCSCGARRAAISSRMHGLHLHDADPRHLHGARLLCRRRPRHCQSRTQIRPRPRNKPQREGKYPRPASRRPANLLKVARFSTRPPDRSGHSHMQQHVMRMVHPW